MATEEVPVEEPNVEPSVEPTSEPVAEPTPDESTAIEPTIDPIAETPASFPSTKPKATGRFKQNKSKIIAAVLVLLLAGAAYAYFGVYTQKPEYIWNRGF